MTIFVGRLSFCRNLWPQVHTAILYGSRAKGSFSNGSDIDLTLEGEPGLSDVLSAIEIDIDDLMLPYTVDLSVRDQINNPNLLDHIHRVGVVFYHDG